MLGVRPPLISSDDEAEPVGEAQLLDRRADSPADSPAGGAIDELVGRNAVVVERARLEWQLGQAADGFGSDPGQGCDRGFVEHAPNVRIGQIAEQGAGPSP